VQNQHTHVVAQLLHCCCYFCLGHAGDLSLSGGSYVCQAMQNVGHCLATNFSAVLLLLQKGCQWAAPQFIICISQLAARQRTFAMSCTLLSGNTRCQMPAIEFNNGCTASGSELLSFAALVNAADVWM
jgi:hypothetical protein